MFFSFLRPPEVHKAAGDKAALQGVRLQIMAAQCRHGEPKRSLPRPARSLANRLHEARLVIKIARKTKVATHFLPASDGANIQKINGWIDAGAVGTLREIHTWSNRPVWPQYPTIPTDTPPVPEGFDWQL